MNAFASTIEKISDWMAKAGAVILGLMTVLILVEIFLWNAFSATTLIADEYSAYGLAAIIFMAAGYCLKEQGHIRITLVLSFLSPRLQRTITFVSTVISTVFMGYLFCYLWKMMSAAHRYGSTSGTLTETPLWIPQTIMLVGAASFFLQFVASSVRTYQAIGKGEDVF